MNPQPGVARLHDIQGLDPIGIWPLAPGWWLVIAALLALVLVAAVLRGNTLNIRTWRGRRQRWQRDAVRQLRALRARIGEADAKSIAAELSELLRRIAIARCGRDACAGLSGDAWLDWLSRHDPQRFDWRGRGRLLLVLAYGPPVDADHRRAIDEMLNATLAWVSQGRDCGAVAVREA